MQQLLATCKLMLDYKKCIQEATGELDNMLPAAFDLYRQPFYSLQLATIVPVKYNLDYKFCGYTLLTPLVQYMWKG